MCYTLGGPRASNEPDEYIGLCVSALPPTTSVTLGVSFHLSDGWSFLLFLNKIIIILLMQGGCGFLE